ncbi:MAG: sensor histidine kinase [Lentisphaerae bacterium]|nr:sensor histidine kinase [Lentisphaerota bacterium]
MTITSNKERRAAGLARRYRSVLRQYLKETTRAQPAVARELGLRAARQGMDVLALAAIHEAALIDEALATQPAGVRQRLVRRAAAFFAEAIVPIEATHRAALVNNARLIRLKRELAQHTRKIATSHRKLTAEIARRTAVEQNLRKSKRQSDLLLRQSRQLQDDLRRLSRRVLSTQEEERKRISRELHDIIAQTLTSINLHLATLKSEATQHAGGLKRNITRTQKLVERSVDKVHRFARELRPAVLDDLGLIPALRSFMESFVKDTGIRVNLKVCAKVEELNNDRRTVLYRIAQEALTNVMRHAHAEKVTVHIRELSDVICMQIHDAGRSFNVERLMRSRTNRCMGLLGMRERVEMVGGSFTITSAPGKGTTVTARVPIRNGYRETRQ